jgi:hypothetical protein
MSNTLFLKAHTIEPPGVKRITRGRHLSEDYSVAAICVSVLVVIFALVNQSVIHWFVLPLMACGILAGVDIVRWLRGRLDLFDPKTIIACLAFYGFFVAPVLNIIWKQFGVGNDMLLWGDDWRTWLGAMGCLNALGLLVYRLAHNWAFHKAKPSRVRWLINRKRFYPIFFIALCSSITGLIAFLWQLGGISGMVEAYEENQLAFVGKGWLLVFAWPLAVLSFIIVVFAWTDRRRNFRNRLTIGLFLLGVAGVGHFLLLGWYGSRVATVAALFWMTGILHHRFRKFSPKVMAIGVISLIAFAYLYGFYKEQKTKSLELLRSPAMWLQPVGYQRDIKYLLLEDLARADSNAFILHNLVRDPTDYDYRWGLTYIGAFSILIPTNFWPDRPYFRVDAGTEALWGKAAATPSSRLYGISGEAMLNFGAFGVAPVFAVYGGLLGWYRRKAGSWDSLDARTFLAPFFTLLFVTALVCDSDVLVFFAVTQGSLITMAVLASGRPWSGGQGSKIGHNSPGNYHSAVSSVNS